MVCPSRKMPIIICCKQWPAIAISNAPVGCVSVSVFEHWLDPSGPCGSVISLTSSGNSFAKLLHSNPIVIKRLSHTVQESQ
ncbi:hypothetical protein ACHAWC_005062 [Mediolabrus comicus]